MRGNVRRAVLALVLGAALLVATPGTARKADAGAPIKLYVFAGQSNMVGAYAAAAELPSVDPQLQVSKDVLFWGPTADFPARWGPLAAPTEIRQSFTRSGFGPEIGAAPLLVKRNPGGVAIVKYAWNGTNLNRHWDPENALGLYGGLINRVRYAARQLQAQGKKVQIAGFFWMQGESDAYSKRHATDYGRNLTHFIASVRDDLRSPRMPFVVSKIRDLRVIDKRYRYSEIVRREQAAVARSVHRTYLVSTDGLEVSALSPIHFSTRGTVALGRRLVSRSIPL